MTVRAYSRVGLVAILIAAGLVSTRAGEAGTAPGVPIIFSPEAKSPSVSSNLSELRRQQSPFQNLENELKRPFELFDRTTESGPRYTRRPTPPPKPENKSAKDSLNQQAEAMYLNPEMFDEKADEAFFRLGEGPDDPYKRKPRNSLERYYDHMDRNRQVVSNRPPQDLFGDTLNGGKTDILGGNSKGERYSQPGVRVADRNDRTAGSAGNGVLIPSPLGVDGEAERSSLRPAAIPFAPPAESAGLTARREPSEIRMEEFKRLLEGPRYNSSAVDSLSPAALNNRPSSSSAALTPANQPALPASRFDADLIRQPDPHKTFVKSANLVGDPGRPHTLPEYDSSVSTPPPPPVVQKPLPPSTFKLPKRRI